MTGAVVASAVLGLLALRTRRSFAWDDPMIALMLVSAALMVVMCASLLSGGQWLAALFVAPMAVAVAVPAYRLGRLHGAPKRQRDDDADDEDGGGGGGGGTPPDDPRPGPPDSGIDWDRFDELREAWARSGSRTRV